VPRGNVAGHPPGQTRSATRRHRARDPDVRRVTQLFRGARVLWTWHRSRVPRGSTGPALRDPGSNSGRA
jgi:hypothetical protein